MPRIRLILAILILTASLGIFTMSVHAQSAFNRQINYQGKLTNASGVPVADGTYNIAFRLYTTATSATTTNIWEELDTTTNKVQVTGGLFSVLLGSTTPLTNVNFNQTLYLGVEIGSTTTPPTWDGEMSPRKKLGAVPAAFEAEKFGGFATTSFLRSDAVNSTTTASNWLTFTNNGAGNIAVFTGSGNVGIGTTTPYAKLSISANPNETKSTLFAISSSTASATSSLFRVLNNGKVGVGDIPFSNGPFSKLEIQTGDALLSASDMLRIRVSSLTSGVAAGIAFAIEQNGSNNGNVTGKILGIRSGSNGIGDLAFYTNSSGISTGDGSTEKMRILSTGSVGVGTSSPYSKLTVWGQGTTTEQAFEIANSASTTIAKFLNNGTGYFLGNIGIGTTTPYAKLSVVGEAVAQMFTATSTAATSTFAGGLNVGSGAITYDYSSMMTTIQNLTMGALSFESDAGILSWTDMPVSSAATVGTVESYSAQMAGNPLLTVYGESLGTGGAWNTGVGVGTTTPYARLSVVGDATTTASARPLFDIASSSGTSFLRVTAFGNLGMGTTTPYWLMQLASSTAPQLALSDGSLTSNHWTFRNAGGNLYIATSSPSTFATSSMSALTVNTNGYLGIATTSPWAALSVSGTVAMSALGTSQGNAICVTASGEITNPGAAVCTGSSEHFKENIETLAPGFALDEISQFRAVSFDYKNGFYSPEDLKGSYGMIAEEVEKIDPKLVDYGYDGKPLTLKFEKFTGLFVQAMQELSDSFKALVARVTGLEEKINTQQSEIDALKARMNVLDGQADGQAE